MDMWKAFTVTEVVNRLYGYTSPGDWLRAVESIPFGFYFGDDGGIYLSEEPLEEFRRELAEKEKSE